MRSCRPSLQARLTGTPLRTGAGKVLGALQEELEEAAARAHVRLQRKAPRLAANLTATQIGGGMICFYYKAESSILRFPYWTLSACCMV